jgi:hypothetical protein
VLSSRHFFRLEKYVATNFVNNIIKYFYEKKVESFRAPYHAWAQVFFTSSYHKIHNLFQKRIFSSVSYYFLLLLVDVNLFHSHHLEESSLFLYLLLALLFSCWIEAVSNKLRSRSLRRTRTSTLWNSGCYSRYRF